MWQAGKDTMVELLGSKKFFIFMASLIAAGAARIGWSVDQAVVDHYLELAGALILAQGVADHGKGAAEVMAKAALTTGTPVVAPPKPSIAPVVMLLAALGGGVALTHTSAGCSGTVKKIETGVVAGIDCGKQDLGQLVGDKTLLATVAIDLAQSNWSDALSVLEGKVEQDALACAVLAVDTVTHANLPVGAEPSPVGQHARAALAAKGWKFASAGGAK